LSLAAEGLSSMFRLAQALPLAIVLIIPHYSHSAPEKFCVLPRLGQRNKMRFHDLNLIVELDRRVGNRTVEVQLITFSQLCRPCAASDFFIISSRTSRAHSSSLVIAAQSSQISHQHGSDGVVTSKNVDRLALSGAYPALESSHQRLVSTRGTTHARWR
jgi:hypothetical protein